MLLNLLRFCKGLIFIATFSPIALRTAFGCCECNKVTSSVLQIGPCSVHNDGILACFSKVNFDYSEFMLCKLQFFSKNEILVYLSNDMIKVLMVVISFYN